MSSTVIPIKEIKTSSTPKGRQVEPAALAEVQALLGAAPRRRDLLIEHLHKIQDCYGHLADRHIVALATEMKLAMTEVYEVATFYHHFDVVKDGEAPPAAITVRVCESLSCEMAGARELLDRLPALLGANVRVIPAPCIGRCESAPACVVGQHPVLNATIASVQTLVDQKAVGHPVSSPVSDAATVNTAHYNAPGAVSPAFVDYERYRAAGGY